MNTIFRDPGSYLKSWIAELVGTFFLLLVALVSPAGMTFAAVGAMLLVLVVTIGNVSGAHVNPAVTAGLVAVRKFPPLDGLVYVVAQVIGALLAVALVALLGRGLPTVQPGPSAFVFELLGAFLLVFAVAHVTVKGVTPTGSALAVGIALALGILVAAPNSGGVLNPAIAVALLLTGVIQNPLSSSWSYLIGPVVGGVLAALLGGYLGTGSAPEVDADEPPAEDEPPADEQPPAQRPARRLDGADVLHERETVMISSPRGRR